MAKQPSPKQEASNETTSAKRLKELAQDAKLASVVAKNPGSCRTRRHDVSRASWQD